MKHIIIYEGLIIHECETDARVPVIGDRVSVSASACTDGHEIFYIYTVTEVACNGDDVIVKVDRLKKKES